MAWPVFPTVSSGIGGPSFPYKENHAPRVLSAKFGDGYSQDVIDGINTDEFATDVTWTALYTTEMITIINFLDGLGGAGRFIFTPPNGVPMTFYCPKWAPEKVAGNVWNVSATFIRKFDIG